MLFICTHTHTHTFWYYKYSRIQSLTLYSSDHIHMFVSIDEYKFYINSTYYHLLYHYFVCNHSCYRTCCVLLVNICHSDFASLRCHINNFSSLFTHLHFSTTTKMMKIFIVCVQATKSTNTLYSCNIIFFYSSSRAHMYCVYACAL